MEPLVTQTSTATWTDYQGFPSEKRFEILNGQVYAMTAPSLAHQYIVGELYVRLREQFQTQGCQVFTSPVDVKLSEVDVLQPDLVVVCDRSQLRGSHIEGAPSLVVEVLSNSSRTRDRVRKLRRYAQAGVQEYWLIEPFNPLVEVLALDGDGYRIAGSYESTDTLKSPSFPELTISLEQVFTTDLEALITPLDQ